MSSLIIFCFIFSILPKSGALGTVAARLKHTLPDLPYDYNALEPYISADIMKLHHQKHHQTYVNNLNAAEEQLAEAMQKGKKNLKTPSQISYYFIYNFIYHGLKFIKF